MADAPQQPATPSSLLLVRLGAVGDVIRTLPLFRALRVEHPGARIGWAVEEPSAGLLEAVPGLDAVHVLPRRSIARELRKPWTWPRAWARWVAFRDALSAADYELVLDVHGTFKAACVARSAAGGRLLGFEAGGSKEGAHRLYDQALPYPGGGTTRISRALLLGRAAGLLPETAPDGSPDGAPVDHGLHFPPEGAAEARGFMRGLAQPVVVLFPFASATAKGRRKLWPAAHWSELATRLASAGASVVVAWGSPREGDEAEAIARAAGGAATKAPATDLVQLAGLLEEASLLVTGDTGPMHLAAAVDTRCLALFGPSDPVINRPHGPGHEVLVHQPLADLQASRVAKAALGMLRAAHRLPEVAS
jgi:lipopolysaccharide heptosyltransferase I